MFNHSGFIWNLNHIFIESQKSLNDLQCVLQHSQYSTDDARTDTISVKNQDQV